MRLFLAAIVALGLGLAPQTTMAQGSFLALSDVHYGTQATRHSWGHGQETSLALWKNAQAEAVRLRDAKDGPDFILYLGDMSAHGQPAFLRKQEITVVLEGLDTIAGDTHRLYYLPGNNDTFDKDYCAFDDGQAGVPFTADPNFGQPGGDTWPALNADATIIDRTHLDQAYYSAYPLLPDTSLRLIALNTVMFTRYYGTSFQNDCGNLLTVSQIKNRINTQIEWLEAQLDDAAAKGEKVLLAMHVPPGQDGYSGGPMWSTSRPYHRTGATDGDSVTARANNAGGQSLFRVYAELMRAYEETIVGQLTAHTHLDDLRILSTCQKTSAGVAIGIPGVTTDHGNNPAMKMFTYRADFGLTEAMTHFASEGTQYDWTPGNAYGFVDTYCPTAGACGGMILADVLNQWDVSQHDQRAKRMLGVLRAGRGTVKGRYYAQAMTSAPANCN